MNLNYEFELDPIDLALIALTQEGLPIVPRPFDILAQKLKISREEVLQRLKKFKAAKAIRRIAAVPNHYRMGYVANGMTVWDVADEVAEELGQKIGDLDFVSHCYLRPRHPGVWPYNLFAMVHGSDRAEAIEKADRIKQLIGDHLRQQDILFSAGILKKTGFRIGQSSLTVTPSPSSISPSLI